MQFPGVRIVLGVRAVAVDQGAAEIRAAHGLEFLGQFVGAALGALIIYAIANNIEGFSSKNNFAANGWDQYSPGGYGIVAAMFVEVVFTALLVYVVLATTSRHFAVGFGGLAAGITLALIHMVTIPVDNTSVNPARSLGVAVFQGTWALEQLWVFIVFPLVGGVVAAGIWHILGEDEQEDEVAPAPATA